MKILDHSPAKVLNYFLGFPAGGFGYVEPAFASTYYENGSEIHGLAFATSKKDMERLDSMEGNGSFYTKMNVKIYCYDGREIMGYIYTGHELRNPGLPSNRYMNLLKNGAIEQNLNSDYIECLNQI